MSVVMSKGIMIAVPLACTTRATSSIGKLGDNAASNVPIENSVIADVNIARVVNRWSRKPVIGITTAIVNMNAVVSHCAAEIVMFNAITSRGMATVIIVSFKITTKAETSNSQITRGLPECSGATALAVSAVVVSGFKGDRLVQVVRLG